jgi:ABC-2 type transport system ATP-binding protein
MDRGKAVLQGDLNKIKKSYGRVNLFVKCDMEIDKYIAAYGLLVVDKNPSQYHLKVTGQSQAMQFLTKLIEDKVPVVKFELREPSLHEIFVEKVGDVHEEK